MPRQSYTPNTNAWALTGFNQSGNSSFPQAKKYNVDAHIGQTPKQPGIFENFNNYFWGFEDDKQEKADVLKGTFIMGVDMNESFLTTRIMPKHYTNNINLTVNSTVYPHQAPNRVPQLGPVRTLSSRRSSKRYSLQRAGVGITMSKSHLREPEGQEDYQNKVTQLVISIAKYLEQDALIALISVGEYGAQAAAKLAKYSPHDMQQVRARQIRRDIHVWAYFQQVTNALPKLDSWIDQMRRELNLQSSLDTYIMSKQISSYLSEYPPDQTIYSIYGPGAQRNIKEHAQFEGKFRNTSVYLTDFFYVGEEGKPVDPLETRTMIGEHVVNEHHSNTNKYYTSEMREIKIFNQEENDWSNVPLLDAFNNCKRFNAYGEIIPFNSPLLANGINNIYSQAEREMDPLHHMVNGKFVPISFLGHSDMSRQVYMDAAETIFTQIKRVAPHLTESEVKKTFAIFENVLDRNSRTPYDEKFKLWTKILSLAGDSISPQGGISIPTFVDGIHPENPLLYELKDSDTYENASEEFGIKPADFAAVSGGRFIASNKLPYLELQQLGERGTFVLRRNLLWELKTKGYSVPPTTRRFEDFETIHSLVLSDLWKNAPFGSAEGISISKAVECFKEIIDILHTAFPNNPIFLQRYKNDGMPEGSKYSVAFEHLIGYKYPFRFARLLSLGTDSRNNLSSNVDVGENRLDDNTSLTWQRFISRTTVLKAFVESLPSTGTGLNDVIDPDLARVGFGEGARAALRKKLVDITSASISSSTKAQQLVDRMLTKHQTSISEAWDREVTCVYDANCYEPNKYELYEESQKNQYIVSRLALGRQALVDISRNMVATTRGKNMNVERQFVIPLTVDSVTDISLAEATTLSSGGNRSKEDLLGLLKRYGPIHIRSQEWSTELGDEGHLRWSLFRNILTAYQENPEAVSQQRNQRESENTQAQQSYMAAKNTNIWSLLRGDELTPAESSRKRHKKDFETLPKHTSEQDDIDKAMITEELKRKFRELSNTFTGVPLAFSLVYMMNPVNARNCRALIHSNIRFPWSFIISRPHIEYAGLSIIKCKAGCGRTYYGNVEALVSEDNIIGIEKTSVWWYSGGIVTDEEDVVVIPNVFINRYIGGGGVDWVDEEVYDPANGIYRSERGESMFSMLIPDHEKLANYLTLSGTSTLTNGAGGNDQRLKKTRDSYWSTAPWYNAYWGWADLEWNRRDEEAFLNSDATYYSEFLKNNQVTCKSAVIYPNEKGEYSESTKTQQTGHWKTVRAGCMGSRLGLEPCPTQ